MFEALQSGENQKEGGRVFRGSFKWWSERRWPPHPTRSLWRLFSVVSAIGFALSLMRIETIRHAFWSLGWLCFFLFSHFLALPKRGEEERLEVPVLVVLRDGAKFGVWKFAALALFIGVTLHSFLVHVGAMEAGIQEYIGIVLGVLPFVLILIYLRICKPS